MRLPLTRKGARVRVSREPDGRIAARLPDLLGCIGYGTSDVEALAEFFTVRTQLEGQDAPRLRPAEDGGWWAESRRYRDCAARGESPARAIAELRKLEERRRR